MSARRGISLRPRLNGAFFPHVWSPDRHITIFGSQLPFDQYQSQHHIEVQMYNEGLLIVARYWFVESGLMCGAFANERVWVVTQELHGHQLGCLTRSGVPPKQRLTRLSSSEIVWHASIKNRAIFPEGLLALWLVSCWKGFDHSSCSHLQLYSTIGWICYWWIIWKIINLGFLRIRKCVYSNLTHQLPFNCVKWTLIVWSWWMVDEPVSTMLVLKIYQVKPFNDPVLMRF